MDHDIDDVPVVFLDLDDCIATNRAFMATGDAIDASAAGLLARLCRDTGARIVVISTWRSDADRCRTSFAKHGLDAHMWSPVTTGSRRWADGDVQDDWCVDWDNGDRSGTMIRWLANHPKVKRWIIVDDSVSNLTPDQMRLLVQPDMQFGFGIDDYRRARRMLGVADPHATLGRDHQTPRHTIANLAKAALDAIDQGDPDSAVALLKLIAGDPSAQ